MVLSPHCDDAVFGCGELLADRPGSTVITVFAGRPGSGVPLTRWDAAAGFGAPRSRPSQLARQPRL